MEIKKYRYVAIIPARGGSKRLLHKNILPLSGKPLVVHSIDYAKQCEKIGGIYVSTDDAEIGKIAEDNGACVIQRPERISGDHCPTIAALTHAVSVLEKMGVDFEYLVLLQATNPLRPSGMLEEAMEVIEKNGYDSLMTVTSLNRKLGKIIDKQFVPFNYEYGQRSQDMEPLYFENGLLYITRKDVILSDRIIGDKMFPMLISHPFGSIDIDSREDFILAENIQKIYRDE